MCSTMKDKKGRDRGKCLKEHCDCDEYIVEKAFCLCAYCEHTPLSHGMQISTSHCAYMYTVSQKNCASVIF